MFLRYESLFGLNSGNGNTMFPCQLRLFRAWFKSWTEQDKQTFMRTLATLDPAAIQYLKDRSVNVEF